MTVRRALTRRLYDLRRAGLPREVEALIISVSDGLVDPSSSIADIAGSAATSRRVTSAIALAREQAAQALEEAKQFAAKAGDRVRSSFPDWKVQTAGLAGSPSTELINKADEWKADLSCCRFAGALSARAVHPRQRFEEGCHRFTSLGPGDARNG